MILTNARVGDDIVDVAIEDGRIASVAPVRDGSAASRDNAIDLEGRWLLPGLWDHHVHFNQQALALRRVDLAEASSAADAARTMAEALLSRPPEPGLPLIGHGFRDGLWADVPHASMLDEAVGDTPTVLISGDLHTAWLNSAALRTYGYAGHPSGVLVEDDCFAVTGALQDVPQATLDSWVADAAVVAAGRGVVGVVDLEMAPNIDNWSRRFAQGFNTLRVHAGIYRQYLDDAIRAGHRSGAVLDADGMLTVGPFKVLTDGSLNTRTAYCIDAYPGTEERGLLTVPPHELVPLLRAVVAAQITPTVHAIGDEANRLALDAFEQVGCGGRMEHAQLVRDEDFPRFAALGVAVSVQPDHAMDDRDVAERYWSGRTGRAFALRSLLDAGAQLLLGSDAPVSPLDPWRTLTAAVTRSRDGREPWHPEQSISVDAALAASTHSRIEASAVADLIAVDRDPSVAENLDGMPVALTVAAGRVTHTAL